eukprot:1488534-Rhodomonas_salina.1
MPALPLRPSFHPEPSPTPSVRHSVTSALGFRARSEPSAIACVRRPPRPPLRATPTRRLLRGAVFLAAACVCRGTNERVSGVRRGDGRCAGVKIEVGRTLDANQTRDPLLAGSLLLGKAVLVL